MPGWRTCFWMPWFSSGRGSSVLLVTTPTYPGGISVGSLGLALDPRAGLDAGIDVDDLDVIRRSC